MGNLKKISENGKKIIFFQKSKWNFFSNFEIIFSRKKLFKLPKKISIRKNYFFKNSKIKKIGKKKIIFTFGIFD